MNGIYRGFRGKVGRTWINTFTTVIDDKTSSLRVLIWLSAEANCSIELQIEARSVAIIGDDNWVIIAEFYNRFDFKELPLNPLL